MANTYESMSVLFDSNASEIERDVASINKTLKSAQGNAKALDKALVMDPGSIETANQLLDTLENTSKLTTKKIDALNQELLDMQVSGAPAEDILKIKAAITDAETESRKLDKEMELLSNHIKNIESGNIEEIDKYTGVARKGAKKLNQELKQTRTEESKIDSTEIKEMDKALDETDDSAGKAESALSGVGDAISDFDDPIQSASGGLQNMMGLFGPWGAAAAAGIGAASAGWNVYKERLDETRQYQRDLASNIMPKTNISIKDQDSNVRLLAKAFDIDYANAADVAIEATSNYNDTITDSNGLMTGMLKTMMQNNSGVLDASDAYTLASQNTKNFNTTQGENEAITQRLTKYMQANGQQAEDMSDTYVEWGDTFAASGQSSEDMFNILNTGLAMGARNTDEVANAWNEFILRMGDGTAEETLNSIGLSQDDLSKKFKQGGKQSQSAVLEVVNALAQETDVTKRTADAQAIFGTQGEEFIATVLKQKDSVEVLSEKVQNQAKYEDNWKKVRESDTTWAKIGKEMDLNSVELDNLRKNYNEQGDSALNAKEKNILYGEGLSSAGKEMGLNKDQIKQMQTAYSVMNGTTDITKVKTDELKSGLENLKNVGMTTDNGIKAMMESQKLWTGQFALNKDAAGQMNETLHEFAKSTDNVDASTKTVDASMKVLTDTNSSAKDKYDALAGANQVLIDSNAVQGDNIVGLTDKMNVLNNSSATQADKYNALVGIVDIYNQANALGGTEAEKMTNALNNQNTALQTGTAENDGFANSAAKAKAQNDLQVKSFQDLLEIYLQLIPEEKANNIAQKLGFESANALREANEGGKKTVNELTDEYHANTKAGMSNKDAIDKVAKANNLSSDEVGDLTFHIKANKTAQEELTKKIKNGTASNKEIADTYKGEKDTVKRLTEENEKNKKSREDLNKKVKEGTASQKDINKVYGEGTSKSKELNAENKKNKDTKALLSDKNKELTDSQKKVNEQVKDGTAKNKDIEKAYSGNKDATKLLTDENKKNADANKKAADANDKNKSAVDKLSDAQKKARKTADNLLKKVQDYNKTKMKDKTPEVKNKEALASIDKVQKDWDTWTPKSKSVSVTKNEKTIKTTVNKTENGRSSRSIPNISIPVDVARGGNTSYNNSKSITVHNNPVFKIDTNGNTSNTQVAQSTARQIDKQLAQSIRKINKL